MNDKVWQGVRRSQDKVGRLQKMTSGETEKKVNDPGELMEGKESGQN